MTIRYIHNDPSAPDALETELAPLPDRTGAVAKLALDAAPPEQVYPRNDDPDFVYWQCRQAALLTLRAWEHIDVPLRRWQNGKRKLDLHHNHAIGLEANYDRRALRFDRWEAHGKTTFSGASTDAVAHEVGHAVLDAARPTLWDSFYTEVAAFHESFADCLAVLVSLFDDRVRDDIVANASGPGAALDEAARVDTIAESIAEAYRASFPTSDPRTEARRARHTLQWVIPITLPPHAPAGHLSREPHSFGQIFTGCFYDTINLIYKRSASKDSAALLAAAETAGRLLAEAVRNATEETRFFRSVGRHMILADENQNGGAHHRAVRDAFADHGIALGSSATLAPMMALAGPATSVVSASPRALSARTRADLVERIGVPRRTPMSLEPMQIGKTRFTRACFRREVPLSQIDRRLRGVVARPVDAVLLGAAGRHYVVLGNLPGAAEATHEASEFVSGLIGTGALRPDDKRKGSRSLASSSEIGPTHAVRKQGSRRVVTRVRFACRLGNQGV